MQSIIFVLAFIAMVGTVAHAQVDATAGWDPFKPRPHYAHTNDDILILDSGDLSGTGNQASIFVGYSEGRIKERNNADPLWNISFKLDSIGIGSDDERIPSGINDIALAVNLDLPELFESRPDWEIWLQVGAGIANDNHFGNDKAYYGIGGVGLIMPRNDKGRFRVGLHFDGNRLFFPDVPLPYFVWQHEVRQDFHYEIGIPRTRFWFRPHEHLETEFVWSNIVEIRADATAWILPGVLGIDATYQQRWTGGVIDDGGHSRLFYRLRCVQAGPRWVTKWFELTAGVGYAFDQAFRAGYDLTDVSTVAHLSDQPYVFISLSE